jgi:predicted TPR repeat methyltransferase
MLGSSIVIRIYNAIKNLVKNCYQFIFNSPQWIKTQIASFKAYIDDVRYKFHHIRDTNIELGIEHLYKRNLNDALIRFFLVNKFFAKGDEEANYWLGWVYLLKNNYAKAIEYLKLGRRFDVVSLGEFLENYQNYKEIPEDVWHQYRELVSSYYEERFTDSEKQNLYEIFVQKTLSQIKELPDYYNILELGSNIGALGYEARKRFPDSFTLTGVECSNSMNALSLIYYSNNKIYDQLMELSIKEFMHESNKSFDVILSLCGFAFTKELTQYLHYVYTILNDSGFFALCLPADDITKISLERLEYVFNQQDVERAIVDSKLVLLSTEKLSLGINKKYSIFICKKTIGN